MRVPNYTKGLVLERAVPNQVDLGRIQEAGFAFEGGAKVLDTTGQIRKQVEVANELTAVNGGVIKRQKDDLDVRSQKQKEWQDNPLGFAKFMELEYKKRDEEYKKTLPTESAKAFYQKEVDPLNLRNYEEDLTWETTRSAERLVNKADQSIGDLEVGAFRGASFDKLNKDLQATMLPLEGILASDEKLKLYEKGKERIASSVIGGLIDRNPYEAKQVLDSRQYDSALGADALATLSIKADNRIEALQKEAKARQNEYTNNYLTDPFLIGGSEDVDTNVANQQRLGIVTGNIKVMSNKKAQIYANELNGTRDVTGLQQKLGQIKEEFGEQYYLKALEQMKKEGNLSSLTSFVLQVPAENADIAQAALQMSLDSKGTTDRATTMSGESVNKIQEQVQKALQDTTNALASETDMSRAIELENNILQVAIFKIAGGESVKDAVKSSIGWLEKANPTSSYNGKRYSIAQGYTEGQIDTALEDAINSTELFDKESATEMAKDEVFPVLKGDKYYLKDFYNRYVQDKNSNYVNYDVAEIVSRREIKQEAITNKANMDTFSDALGD